MSENYPGTSSNASQLKIPATYMRGGTNKGIFFKLKDLPIEAHVAVNARDNLFGQVSIDQPVVDWSNN